MHKIKNTYPLFYAGSSEKGIMEDVQRKILYIHKKRIPTHWCYADSDMDNVKRNYR